MGVVTDRWGCSGSSSGMDREGGRWHTAREDANDERCGSEGSEERESLEVKRESLAPAVERGADN